MMKKPIINYLLFLSTFCIAKVSIAQTQEENTYPYPHKEDVGIGFPITTNGSGSLNYKLTAASRLFQYSFFDEDLGEDFTVKETIPFRILAESYEDFHEERTNFLMEARVFPYGEEWTENDRVYSLQKDGAILLGVNSNSTTNYGFAYSIISDNSIYSQDKVLAKTRIGIGTTSPASSLDVTNGDVSLNNNYLKLQGASSSTNYLKYQSNFLSNSLNGPILMGANGGALATSASGTRAVLTWKNSGKVGINTMTPTEVFEVNGTVKFDRAGISGDEIQFENWSGFHRIAFNSLRFHEWGIGDFFYLTDGKVGIGNSASSPSMPLDIGGNTTINSYTLFLKDGNTNSKNYLKYYSNYDGNTLDGVVLSGESGGALGSDQGGVLYWKDNGRVGIGTSAASPAMTLDISGNTTINSNSLFLKDGNTNSKNYLKYYSSYDGNSLDGVVLSGESGGALGSDQGGVLYWNDNGRVGVGTYSPIYTLDVEGVINSEGGVRSNGYANNGKHAFVSDYSDFGGSEENISWYTKNPKFVNLIGTSNPHAGFGVADGSGIHSPVIWMYNSSNEDNALRVKTMDFNSGIDSGQDLLVVKEDGKVGINTENPSMALEVNGWVKFDVSSFTDGEIKFEPHNNFHRIVFNELRLYENGIGDRITIRGGNVGVNMNNPAYELDVNGIINSNSTIQATLLKTTTGVSDAAIAVENTNTSAIDFMVKGNGYVYAREVKISMDPIIFPDYVFEKDYNLMSFSQLRTFISEEKRLPGVISAEDVKKDKGVEIGELSRIQMEKIEELTLYILELEERISKLEAMK